MAYQASTKGFSQPGPDMAMLFAPFGCTHPFCPRRTYSSQGYDIMKVKVL